MVFKTIGVLGTLGVLYARETRKAKERSGNPGSEPTSSRSRSQTYIENTRHQHGSMAPRSKGTLRSLASTVLHGVESTAAWLRKHVDADLQARHRGVLHEAFDLSRELVGGLRDSLRSGPPELNTHGVYFPEGSPQNQDQFNVTNMTNETWVRNWLENDPDVLKMARDPDFLAQCHEQVPGFRALMANGKLAKLVNAKLDGIRQQDAAGAAAAPAFISLGQPGYEEQFNETNLRDRHWVANWIKDGPNEMQAMADSPEIREDVLGDEGIGPMLTDETRQMLMAELERRHGAEVSMPVPAEAQSPAVAPTQTAPADVTAPNVTATAAPAGAKSTGAVGEAAPPKPPVVASRVLAYGENGYGEQFTAVNMSNEAWVKEWLEKDTGMIEILAKEEGLGDMLRDVESYAAMMANPKTNALFTKAIEDVQREMKIEPVGTGYRKPSGAMPSGYVPSDTPGYAVQYTPENMTRAEWVKDWLTHDNPQLLDMMASDEGQRDLWFRDSPGFAKMMQKKETHDLVKAGLEARQAKMGIPVGVTYTPPSGPMPSGYIPNDTMGHDDQYTAENMTNVEWVKDWLVAEKYWHRYLVATDKLGDDDTDLKETFSDPAYVAMLANAPTRKLVDEAFGALRKELADKAAAKGGAPATPLGQVTPEDKAAKAQTQAAAVPPPPAMAQAKGPAAPVVTPEPQADVNATKAGTQAAVAPKPEPKAQVKDPAQLATPESPARVEDADTVAAEDVKAAKAGTQGAEVTKPAAKGAPPVTAQDQVRIDEVNAWLAAGGLEKMVKENDVATATSEEFQAKVNDPHTGPLILARAEKVQITGLEATASAWFQQLRSPASGGGQPLPPGYAPPTKAQEASMVPPPPSAEELLLTRTDSELDKMRQQEALAWGAKPVGVAEGNNPPKYADPV